MSSFKPKSPKPYAPEAAAKYSPEPTAAHYQANIRYRATPQRYLGDMIVGKQVVFSCITSSESATATLLAAFIGRINL